MGNGGDGEAAASHSISQNDLLRNLRHLSISDDSGKNEKRTEREKEPAPVRPPSSQYELNYRPMVAGLRRKLWEEGYRHRNQRKLKGFRHEKLEWRVPAIERPPSRKRGSAGKMWSMGSREPSSDYETLFLPPTKLQMKSLKLRKIYEKQQLHRRPSTSQPGRRTFKMTADKEDTDVAALTSYARNKLNNSKSHIALPTYESSTSIFDSPACETCETGKSAAGSTRIRPFRPKTAALAHSAAPRQSKSAEESGESKNADVGVQVEYGKDVSFKSP